MAFNLSRWRGIPTIGGGCNCPQTPGKAPNCLHHQRPGQGCYFEMRGSQSHRHAEKQAKRAMKPDKGSRRPPKRG